MNRQDIEALADEELVRHRLAEHRRKTAGELQKIALDAAKAGTGSFVGKPFMKTGGDDHLQRVYDFVDPELEPGMAGSLKRVRYAHDHLRDLGPEVFTRAVVDVWRETEAPCKNPGFSKDTLMERLLVGDKDRKQAVLNLASACGGLPEASGVVAAHSLMTPVRKLVKTGTRYAPVGADLAHIDLRGADLHDAQLEKANLYYANLQLANLSGANLKGADLSAANLQQANLKGAYLRSANLISTNLNAADLSGANLLYVDVNDANFAYADLRGANLKGIRNVRGADFENAERLDSDPLVPGYELVDGVLQFERL